MVSMLLPGYCKAATIGNFGYFDLDNGKDEENVALDQAYVTKIYKDSLKSFLM